MQKVFAAAGAAALILAAARPALADQTVPSPSTESVSASGLEPGGWARPPGGWARPAPSLTDSLAIMVRTALESLNSDESNAEARTAANG